MGRLTQKPKCVTPKTLSPKLAGHLGAEQKELFPQVQSVGFKYLGLEGVRGFGV